MAGTYHRRNELITLMTTLTDTIKARRDGEDAMMTPRQVACLLKIDIETVRLWSVLGVLRDGGSPGASGQFRRADVLTFLLAPLPGFSRR